MTDDVAWGPWVEHDGKGCPIAVMGRLIQAELLLACGDERGGRRGDVRIDEGIIELQFFHNPMWRWENYGELFVFTTGPYKGREFRAAKVLRYRIRKDRSVELMKAKAAALDCVSPKVLADV